jgi:hypothetical protein
MDDKPILDYANPPKPNPLWVRRIRRIVAGVAGLGAFTPLVLLIHGGERFPVWEQWVTVAVFTPMGLVWEWIVLTGRTEMGRSKGKSRANFWDDADGPETSN